MGLLTHTDSYRERLGDLLIGVLEHHEEGYYLATVCDSKGTIRFFQGKRERDALRKACEGMGV